MFINDKAWNLKRAKENYDWMEWHMKRAAEAARKMIQEQQRITRIAPKCTKPKVMNTWMLQKDVLNNKTLRWNNKCNATR